MPNLPSWLKVKLPGTPRYYEVRANLSQRRLNTVCEEARCPNIAECWGGGTATFMILGDICTRGCRFCDVRSGKPQAPAADEAENVVRAVAELGLHYVVITSVDRDDLADQGATHFGEVVAALKRANAALTVEVLTPDFSAQRELLAILASCGADVLGHNLETTRTHSARVRDRRCDYDLSLRVLADYRQLAPSAVVKSSLMLGLGEGIGGLRQAMRDLRACGVDWITFGQYLRPSRKHLEVTRFVHPDEFAELAAEARELGFPLVSAGPLMRSSYRAGEGGAKALLEARGHGPGANQRSLR